MERLNRHDLIMLGPDQTWPQEIGVLATLEGDRLVGPDGNIRLDGVRAAVARRLDLLPRFRQLVHRPGPALGPPLWVDAAAFDIDQHIRVRQLAQPGTDEQLVTAIEQIRQHRLDWSRPLWEMWFLPGLPGGRVGWYARLHHAIADGIAGMAMLATLLDEEPVPVDATETLAPGPSWVPGTPPPAGALLADNLRRCLRGLGSGLVAATRPVRGIRALRATWPALRELSTGIRGGRTSLHRLVGPHRQLTLVRSDLDLFRRIAHRHGAAINDVLLTITAGGLRELLRHRDESLTDRDLWAFTYLARDRSRVAGNLVAPMVVPLPVAEPDPRNRLELIAAVTAERKARERPSLGTLLGNPIARRIAMRLGVRQPVNVSVTSVPGPLAPRFLATARLLDLFPVVPLVGSVTVGVAALSYSGQFNLGIVTDLDACPDAEVLVAGIRHDLGALERAAPAAVHPSQFATAAEPGGRSC